jgi:uncharacterized protein (DUF983 family)
MRDRDDEFDLDESDDLDDEGGDEDDSGETMPCPHCLGTIYDDSERCPHCGEYLSRGDAPRQPPWWVVAGVGVCLVIVFRWIIKLH